MALLIDTDWELLEVGAPEERACFAAIGIFSGQLCLTQAEDILVNRVRRRVHLSAYKLAEWLAWNWWRLRWEPRSQAMDWKLSHNMTTIGDGYVWPNITIISDGERIVLITEQTERRPTEPIRYIVDSAVVLRAVEYEGAISRFLESVQEQLRAERIETTNLDKIWSEVRAERAEPGIAKRRQLEALLGFDPDEADPALIERLVGDADTLGEDSVRELAATSLGGGKVPTFEYFRGQAAEIGFDVQPNDAVRLGRDVWLPKIGEVAAWQRGVEAAQRLRVQEHLGLEPISNKKLAEMSGTTSTSLEHSANGLDISFAIDRPGEASRLVLRSKWGTGRRFELARILGDRIASGSSGRLRPATRTHTYRQKLQRSFSAELLCPFDGIEDLLKGNYSEENQEECAQYFQVSPLTVRNILVNHRRIDREDLNYTKFIDCDSFGDFHI